MRPTKKASERAHAKSRALQRYGLTLKTRDLDELATTIMACWRGLLEPAPARLVVRQSQRVSVWKMECQGVPVQVVFDSQRKVIVSFLPYDTKPFSAAERAEHRRRNEAALCGDIPESNCDMGAK